MWKIFNERLAAFLLEDRILKSSETLKTTHDKIANHLGTAREVVPKMLHYIQFE